MSPNNTQLTPPDMLPPDTQQVLDASISSSQDSNNNVETLEYVSNPFKVLIDNLSRLFSHNLVTLLGFIGVVIMLFLFIPVAILVAILFTDVGLLPILFASGVIFMVFWFIFLAGFTKYTIETARHNEVSFKQCILTGANKAAGYFLINVIYLLVVLLGLIFFIIPGILFAIWFVFANYVYVDQDISPIKAFEYSKRLTSGKAVEIVGMFSTLGLVSILGAIPLLGLILELILTPLARLSWAYRYSSAKMLDDNNMEKPPTHVANKVMLVLAVLIVAMIVSLLLLFIAVLAAM